MGLLQSSRKVATRELTGEQSGKTGHETEPRRRLGVVATETEGDAARDRWLMRPTTKEKSSQFRSRPNTSVKHHLVAEGGRGGGKQKPTGCGGRASKTQDGGRASELTTTGPTRQDEDSQVAKEARSTTRARGLSKEGMLWPVRPGRKQEDIEAFWEVSCGVWG